jgi:hypothetical protein
MSFVCRWVADKDVPGGRYFVPGCWGGAMAREGDELANCHCNRRKAKADLFQRVEQLERSVAELVRALSHQPQPKEETL